jgi:Tol biopolymer transport system component
MGLYFLRGDPLEETHRVEFELGEGPIHLAFNPSGDTLATAHGDSQVRIWDSASGRLLKTLNAHGESVHLVLWSPDGERLISVSDTIEMWNTNLEEVVDQIEGGAMSLAISPDGTTLAAGYYLTPRIDIWDITTEARPSMQLSTCNAGQSIAYSPDGRWIATARGSPYRQVCLWDATSGELIHELFGQDGGINVVAFSPDSKYLAAGDDHGVVHLWRSDDAQLVARLSSGVGSINTLIFHPHDQMLTGMDVGGWIRFWDLTKVLSESDGWNGVPGAELVMLKEEEAAPINPSLRLTDSYGMKALPAWSPTGDWIAYSSHYGNAGINLLNTECIAKLGQRFADPFEICEQNAIQVVEEEHISYPNWSPDGSRFVLTGFHDLYIVSLDDMVFSQFNKIDSVSDERHPAWSPDGNRIAFVSQRSQLGESDTDIYIEDFRGGPPKRLTEEASEEDYPHWSVKDVIAFVSDRYGSLDVFTVRPDGQDLYRLVANDQRDETMPRWSPDGDQIAMYSFPYGREENAEILILDIPSNQVKRFAGLEPTYAPMVWSPDGEYIAFTSTKNGAKDIYAIALDDRSLIQVTDFPADDYSPNWSPDGDRIVYGCERDGHGEICVTSIIPDESFKVFLPDLQTVFLRSLQYGYPGNLSITSEQFVFSGTVDEDSTTSYPNHEIFITDLSGEEPRRLTYHPAFDSSPSLSPDGQWIAFSSNREGDQAPYFIEAPSSLYIMDNQGDQVRKLTEMDGGDLTWSWDGNWIAFSYPNFPVVDIYIIRPDGSDLRMLTDGTLYASSPSWSPDGKRIAFAGHDPQVEGIGEDDIYLVNVDEPGSVEFLVDKYQSDSDPKWSPDGQWIAFTSKRQYGERDLYLISDDGKKIYRLTEDIYEDWLMGWSREKFEILFISTREGEWGLYKMDVTELVQAVE